VTCYQRPLDPLTFLMKSTWSYIVLLFAFLVLIGFFFAEEEIQIEGSNSWAGLGAAEVADHAQHRTQPGRYHCRGD